MTRIETAEILKKGVSAVVSGRSLREQLEAINHDQAINMIKKLALQRSGHQFITQADILGIHKLILKGINDAWAGRLRNCEVFGLVQEFVGWLEGQQGVHPVQVAAQAHFKLVTIHPFIDGNGRTARLLMNLILLLNGYPQVVIRNEDRIEYLRIINLGQKQDKLEPFYQFVAEAVERSLDAYLQAAKGKSFLSDFVIETTEKQSEKEFLKIGQLAKTIGETQATIRHWVELGLLEVASHTESGYQLFNQKQIQQVKKIRQLQREQRLSLREIKEVIKE